MAQELGERGPVQPRHVFTPYRLGVPSLKPYIEELWSRRRFAYELALSSRRSRHVDTVFGQLWSLLNPILLAVVYWFLIAVLRGSTGGFEQLVALVVGLFAFFYSREAMSAGAGSVVGGGGLLLNSAFPRMLLPISAMIGAMLNHRAQLFLLAILVPAAGFELHLGMLWVLPLLLLQTVITCGLMLSLSVVTVYFRDTSSLLSYILRIWLYLSPVLYFASEVPDRFKAYTHLNPLFDVLSSWQRVIVLGQTPSASEMAWACGWAGVSFIVGVCLFLLKEREFAFRI